MTNIFTKTYAHGIYISGVDPSGLDPEKFIYAKIGQANNNSFNRDQRLGECQRQIPNAIEHAWLLTDQGDRLVNDYLCKTYPNKFGGHSGRGRDVIKFRVKDFSFLITEANKYFNFDRYVQSLGKQFCISSRTKINNCLRKTQEFFSILIMLAENFSWDAKMRFGKTHTA